MTGYQKQAITKAATNFAEEIQRIFEQPGMPTHELKEEVIRQGELAKMPDRNNCPISQDELHLGMQRDNIEGMQMGKAPAKDWEILEFRNAEGAKMRRIPGCSGFQFRIEGDERELVYPLNEMIGDKDWPIHSVRRLSDNKTWTIKDKCRVDGKNLSIDRFYLDEDGMFVDVGLITTPPLSALEPIVKPLFTTADGVVHYDASDYVFAVFTTDGRIKHKPYEDIDPIEWSAGKPEIYHTQEAAVAAREKWEKQQPVLTYYEVFEWGCTGDHDFSLLESVVKRKLKSK